MTEIPSCHSVGSQGSLVFVLPGMFYFLDFYNSRAISGFWLTAEEDSLLAAPLLCPSVPHAPALFLLPAEVQEDGVFSTAWFFLEDRTVRGPGKRHFRHYLNWATYIFILITHSSMQRHHLVGSLRSFPPNQLYRGAAGLVGQVVLWK